MPNIPPPHTLRGFRNSDVKIKTCGDEFLPLQLTFSVAYLGPSTLLVLL